MYAISKFAATSTALLLLCLALVSAEPRQGLQQVEQKQLRTAAAADTPNHPYLFLTVPRNNGNGHDVQGFKVVEIDDDDDDDQAAAPINKMKIQNKGDSEESDDDDVGNNSAVNDDDDEEEQVVRKGNVEVNDDDDDDNMEYNDDDGEEDDDDEHDLSNNLVYLRSRAPHTPRVRSQANKNEGTVISTDGNRVGQLNAQLVLKNAKPTNMMISREHAGAIMIPDGIIEIEGQSVVDEKTGKTALLVPRAALDAIPDGSVVALMESPESESEEARANRVFVRRRRKGSRRNVVRRGGGGNRRRRGGNRRRRTGSKRKNVRVYQVGSGSNRRRVNRRGRRPVVLQG